MVTFIVNVRKKFHETLFFGVVFLLLSSFHLCATESVQSTPFFQASKKQPYHLSIGAVLFDQDGRIACHHFREILGHKDIYILMRESMENNETPLMTLDRGLKEEFGATAQPVAFLGCLSGYLPDSHLSLKRRLFTLLANSLIGIQKIEILKIQKPVVQLNGLSQMF